MANSLHKLQEKILRDIEKYFEVEKRNYNQLLDEEKHLLDLSSKITPDFTTVGIKARIENELNLIKCYRNLTVMIIDMETGLRMKTKKIKELRK